MSSEPGIVIEFEHAIAAAHERARGGRGRFVSQPRQAAAPQHTPPSAPPTAEQKAAPRGTASVPPSPPKQQEIAMSTSPFLTFLKRADDIADRVVSWGARRVLDMAPGAALGLGISKLTGVSPKVAVPVGMAASQAVAVGIDYALRDKTLAPEAAAARRAFTRITDALGRGVPAEQVVADMVAGGWTHDQAQVLVARAAGLAGDLQRRAG